MVERERRSGGAAAWPGAAFLGAWMVRALGATWRYVEAPDWTLAAAIPSGRPRLYVLWHARMLALIHRHRDLDVAVPISRSRDGELIAGIVRRLGYRTPRGSSSRGGSEAMLEMLRWSARGHSMAFTPDGPRGPAGVLKAGAVFLASHSGTPVVPVAAAGSRAWVARSWDRFRVPAPFTRVSLAYGPALEVPNELDETAAEAWRVRLEHALNSVTAAADAHAGGRA